MQYTSKIALLAIALFGTSALAAPFAGEAEYDIEAREVDNDLEAREFFETYLEAREDPSLDARDVAALDLEAREYLEYLEAREVASERPQTPATPQSAYSQSPPSPHVETSQTTPSESKPQSDVHLTPHQKSMLRAKLYAAQEFENPQVYRAALDDKTDKLHRFAVARYLKKAKHLKKALANVDSPYHKAAKRIVHRRKAKVYLSDKHNYKNALKHKHHKYHKDAVQVYFTHGSNFVKALSHKKSKFHKAAVREYLLDRKTRKAVLSDPSNPFYKQAKKMQKKINKRLRKLSSGSPSHSSNSTTSTTTPSKA